MALLDSGYVGLVSLSQVRVVLATTPLLCSSSVTMKLLFVVNTMKYFKPAPGATCRPAANSAFSSPAKPVSLPLVNGVLKSPEVTIETDEDGGGLSPVAVDETQKEDGSGTKLRPSLGVFKRGTSKIGKIVSRTRSTRMSSGDENQLSPVVLETPSNLGEDEPFSLTKKLRGSMRIGRTSTCSTEYIAYESATTYTPLSSRQMMASHTDEEDGEYFAIHKLNMDVHSQTLVAANCAGHVLVLDFLSRPFKKHSNQQVCGYGQLAQG